MPRTLDELMEESKQYIYKEPEKPREHWENDEWFFKAISIVIMEPVLIKSAQIICNWFPPMKLLFKTTIKNKITSIIIPTSSEFTNVCILSGIYITICCKETFHRSISI